MCIRDRSITCSTATLNGVYTFNGSGYGLTSNAVTGAWNGAGLLQFDGTGNLTVTLAIDGANSGAGAATGSYSISSVSYTHLDVYKRQSEACSFSRWPPPHSLRF